ncbi:methyl-accepting chemotaxis protein [Paenibacillus phyllosphaerae]|uniref:Methyl-accepting chemotaxis protein n=1 Tax=Paenibacillus phyllosphaerae TaxID=274593 RepID=A0A7W5B0T3_9BACL|nr:methyl-accepting chemotaxis protein [Paenibacillus phyllosphaerae]MBB3111606.1 methyl-accepting chemotaxis protein [Paenibacillus phyllosphaerae]
MKSSLIVTGLMAIALGSVSFLGYDKAKDSLERNFQQQADQQLTNVKNYIDIWIDGNRSVYKALAEADEMKAGDIEKIMAYSTRLSEMNQNPDEFAFIDAKGTLYLPGATVDVSSYAHFQQAVKGETVTVDPVGSSSPGVEGTPIVLTATPVKDAEGHIIGVSNGGQPINELIDLISKVKLGETGHATVFTKEGTIVAGQNPEDTLHSKIADLQNDTLNQVVQDSTSGKTGITEAVINGVNNIVVYGKASSMDWGIMITVPKSEAYADANALLKFLIAITVISLIIAAIINYALIRRLLKPLTAVTDRLRSLSSNEGDLTTRLPIETNDEVGALSANFNSMLSNLQELIKTVLEKGNSVTQSTLTLQTNVGQMSASAEVVTASIQDSVQGLQNQLEGYDHNLNSVGGISTSIAQIAATTASTSRISDRTSEEATKGNEIVCQLSEQMTLIQDTVNDSAAIIKKLGDRSEEIGNITSLITSIASQTNLLALNASIEAARAGEHGRGFAVVADEVRKLAEQSTDSAGQITRLINEIQADTLSAVQSMAKGTGEVVTGMNRAREVGDLFGHIVESVRDVAVSIESISSSSEVLNEHAKQVKGTIETNYKVAHESSENFETIGTVSEEQLASISEINGSVNQLAETAGELLELLSKFKVR